MAASDIEIVLGANYGDEGKGHLTNFLSQAGDLNVRFNGGAQAAHTVVLNDGRQHVFHHYGSGSLKGAETHLTTDFLLNTLVLDRETAELQRLRAPLAGLGVDPNCLVTTPYDMVLNEFFTKRRGSHDSCGLGIHETLVRSRQPEFALRARDLTDRTRVLQVLQAIRDLWLDQRLAATGVLPAESSDFRREVFKTDYPTWFWESIERTRRLISLRDTGPILARAVGHRRLIFEGAQGLLLDQNRRQDYPWLTPSNTGVTNLLGWLGRELAGVPTRVSLVSRTYFSRHGDGPLLNGLHAPPSPHISDPTNPENRFQGRMRYAPLELDWLDEARALIADQLRQAHRSAEVGFAFTCLDHLEGYHRASPGEAWLVYTQRSRTGSAVRVGPISRLTADRPTFFLSDDRREDGIRSFDGSTPPAAI